MLADLAVLSADFFSIDEEAIKSIESVLTIVGGKVVYDQDEFTPLAPARAAALPHQCQGACGVHAHAHDVARGSKIPVANYSGFWGALGCSRFAF